VTALDLANLRRLADVYEIERVLRLYCRAIDRGDVELLRSLYHPDATESHGFFEGSGHDFAAFITRTMPVNTTYGVHMVGNAIVDVDEDMAVSECVYSAYYRVKGEKRNLAAFFGPSYATAAEAAGRLDVEHEYVSGGRYLDRFERRDDIWRISARAVTSEWSQCAPISSVTEGIGHPFALQARRDASDPVYVNVL
jgi:hypothetical protein